jgi:hypothetical protein
MSPLLKPTEFLGIFSLIDQAALARIQLNLVNSPKSIKTLINLGQTSNIASNLLYLFTILNFLPLKNYPRKPIKDLCLYKMRRGRRIQGAGLRRKITDK